MPQHRQFRGTTVRYGGSPTPGYKIHCKTCGASDFIISSKGNGVMPDQLVEKKFTQRNWEVGRNDNDDLCPRCVADATAARRARTRPAPPPAVINLKDRTAMPTSTIPPKVISTIPPKVGSPSTEPPRSMSIEDRRLIFSKIHDVYLDGVRGYTEGWSDKRVALDLGVPQAWVEKLRHENFGAAGDNAELRGKVEEALKFCHDLTSKLARISEQRMDIDKSITEALGMRHQLDNIEKTIMELKKAVV